MGVGEALASFRGDRDSRFMINDKSFIWCLHRYVGMLLSAYAILLPVAPVWVSQHRVSQHSTPLELAVKGPWTCVCSAGS